jgi:histidinol-phosphate aminotransferase
MAALETSGQLLANIEQIKVQRDRIMVGVLKMGLKPLPSDANFVLIQGFEDTQVIFESLLAKGIIVRDIGIPGCLRVTAGTEAETTKLLGELALLLD